jgi:Tol biopolymer transport system component/DNA-binding winged helix-turn-helix (wHTH) protein
LFCSGTRLHIQEQPLRVLRLLLEADGKVVTREQLRSALWPENTFVDFEHGVNTAVKKLRQALEDSAENPKFVETLPKLGYRFMLPVEWIPNAMNTTGQSRVVPIAPPGPVAVPPADVRQRAWKLKATDAATALAIVTTAVLLISENSPLSHTRWGAWLHQAAFALRLEPRPALGQRRLTANTDDAPVTGGVISPDGKYLAYTDASGFYLRQVDGGETHALPLPKDFDALPESWFPDSAHLVVTWFGYQKDAPGTNAPGAGPPSLWKISVLGGPPRKIAERGSSARVSPDGSKIAYLTGFWDSEQIWLMDADGGNARTIVDGGHEGFGAVAWAPDGKRFACVRTRNSAGPNEALKQIELFDVASGRTAVVLSDSRLGDNLVWTNTGRLIYSLQEHPPNQADSNLWWVRVNPRTARLSGNPARITNDRADVTSLSVAADGKRMAVRRSTFQTDGYISEIEERGRRLSAPRRYTLDEGWDWPTAWTPDSKGVLFISDRDGTPHIFKQGIDQMQPELLVGGSAVISAPRPTPDGGSVLYAVNANPDKPNDNFRLMRAPISGGPSHGVLEIRGMSNYQCARLPSTLCIYGQTAPNSDYIRFFSFDPAGTMGRELLPGKVKKGEGPAAAWSLSPDGKYLVTPRSPDPYEAPGLRIFSLTEGTEQNIPIPDIGLMMGMDWAADSKSVWVGGYMGRGAWGTRSGLLNVDLSGRTRVMLKGFSPTLWFAIPSPDGRRLSLCQLTQKSNLWLLENF